MIKLGKSTTVAFLLAFLLYSNGCKRDEPAGPSENHPPIISEIRIGDNPVYFGETTSLKCIAEDEDGDELSYFWTSNYGYLNPIIGNPVEWTAPQNKINNLEYKVNVSVDDKNGGINSKEISLKVLPYSDTFYVSQDADINRFYPNESEYDIPEIYICYYASEGEVYEYKVGLLQFSDLGEDNVKKATLSLAVSNSYDSVLTCDVHKI